MSLARPFKGINIADDSSVIDADTQLAKQATHSKKKHSTRSPRRKRATDVLASFDIRANYYLVARFAGFRTFGYGQPGAPGFTLSSAFAD